MDIAASLLITMAVTFYIPAAGGINGDLHMADGTEANIGYAACGPRYPFGTVFEITLDMNHYGAPQVFECRDRGGAVGNFNLDLVMRTGDLKQDWAYAKAWGKRRVYKNWGDYVSVQQAKHDAALAAQIVAKAEAAEQLTPMP